MQGGGKVALDPGSKEAQEPSNRAPAKPEAFEKLYHLEVELHGARARGLGERVYIRLVHKRESLYSRVKVFFRRLLLKRLNVLEGGWSPRPLRRGLSRLAKRRIRGGFPKGNNFGRRGARSWCTVQADSSEPMPMKASRFDYPPPSYSLRPEKKDRKRSLWNTAGRAAMVPFLNLGVSAGRLAGILPLIKARAGEYAV